MAVITQSVFSFGSNVCPKHSVGAKQDARAAAKGMPRVGGVNQGHPFCNALRLGCCRVYANKDSCWLGWWFVLPRRWCLGG